MHTLEVFGLDQEQPRAATAYTYPGGWNECSVADLARIAALTSVPLPEVEGDEARAKDRHEAHLRLWLLRNLCGMPDAVFSRIEVTDLLDVKLDDIGAERVVLLPSLDWCIEAPLFAQSLVPEVKVGKQVFRGPGNLLSGMMVLQWGFCDLLLNKLAANATKDNLHNLMGALYHEQASDWNNAGIESRGAVLSKLDDRTKLAAVINYRGLRAAIAAKYYRCFKGGKADPHGVRGMIVRMAGPKFGTVEQTRHADLNDVLIHVEQLIQDDERAEAARKNLR